MYISLFKSKHLSVILRFRDIADQNFQFRFSHFFYGVYTSLALFSSNIVIIVAVLSSLVNVLSKV